VGGGERGCQEEETKGKSLGREVRGRASKVARHLSLTEGSMGSCLGRGRGGSRYSSACLWRFAECWRVPEVLRGGVKRLIGIRG